MSGTRKTVTMLNNTGSEVEVVGDPIRADNYFGYTDGLATVQIEYQNFTGGLGIQGTLSLGNECPGKVNIPDEDWFWIHLADQTGNCSEYQYIVYPKDPLHPTSGSGQDSGVNSTGDTGTEAFTFIGNFTYLRAVVTRSYIDPPVLPQPNGQFLLGQDNRVLISL